MYGWFICEAANGRREPDSTIVILCCARSQHRIFCTRANIRDALQRMLRPFVQVAA